MKILRVGGENLASLPTFDVDFTARPLQGAALFAIAGPTGAGKSTLLDAICLSLYGQTPRSGRGERRKVELAPGRKWSGQDERHVVRRGATSAHARVLFEVSGERYAARWAVTAASRGPNKGVLGAPVLKLSRVGADGAEGEVVASGVEELGAAVERLTGLSFQNFCRSVLLAQGEFSAFLDARPAERAKVLEALTDPDELYRKLSVAAFRRGGEADKRLRSKRDEVERVAVLPPAEKAQLEAEVAARQAEVEGLAAVLEGLRKAEAHWGELAEAQRQEALEQGLLRGAGAALAAKAPAARVLEEAESVRPLREPLALKVDAARRCESARASLAGLSGRLAAAREAARAEEAALEQAREQAAAEAQRAADGQAARMQAQGLDGERTVTARQAAEAAAQVEGLERDIQAGEAARAAVEAELQGMSVKREACHRWLAENPEAVPLSATPEAWRGHLHRWVEEAAVLREERPRLDAAERALTAAGEALRAATQAQGAAQQQALEAAAAARAAEARRQGLGRSVSVEQSGQLQRRKAALAGLERLGRLGVELWAKLQAAEADAARERGGAAQAGAEVARLQGELARCEQAEEACRALQAASRARAELEERRKHLVDGEACPLCGSLEHPFAAGVEAGVDAADAALKQASAAVQAARTALSGAEAARNTAGVRAESLEREAGRYRGELEVARADWAREAAAFTGLPAALDVEGLPAQWGVLAAEVAREEAALLDAEAERQAAEAEANRLRDLEDEAEARARAADEAAQRAREAHHGRQLEREGLALAVADRARRMEEGLGRALEGLAQVPRARARFLGNPSSQLQAWEGLVGGYTAREKALRELEFEELGARGRSSALQGQLEQARARQGQWAAQRGVHEQVLRGLEARISGLLGGRTLEAHLAEERRVLEAARAQQEAAEAAVKAGRDGVARLEGECRQAEGALAASEAALRGREEALAAELAGLGLDEAEALRRLSHPEEALAALKTELDAAREAVTQARARLDAVQQARQRLEAGRPEKPLETLRREEAEHESRRSAASEALGAARELLSRDGVALARRAALEAEYEALKAQEGTWGELSALLGSATGDEFAVYAQGLSLRGVLSAANRELGGLRARYQLARLSEGGGEGLELAVRDTAFGGELRPLTTLSGGEKFLSSLSLALGLSARASRNRPIETLFIDEGFGTLDKKTLDEAMAALKALQGRGTQVGIISHVENVKDYVQATVRVRPVEEGLSEVVVEG